MIEVKKYHPIPIQIEALFNSIDGELRCGKCGEMLCSYGVEDEKSRYYLEFSVQKHKCKIQTSLFG